LQVLIDTSAVISIIDKSHHLHKKIKELVLVEENLYIIPSTVIVEVCQLLKYKFDSSVEISFLKEIIKTIFLMESVKYQDMSRILEILIKYKDLNIGYVDSSIVAMAERLKTNKILTLDKKHFSVVIPSGFKYFDILI
jgi:predicted nucleic acid-binding protein